MLLSRLKKLLAAGFIFFIAALPKFETLSHLWGIRYEPLFSEAWQELVPNITEEHFGVVVFGVAVLLFLIETLRRLVRPGMVGLIYNGCWVLLASIPLLVSPTPLAFFGLLANTYLFWVDLQEYIKNNSQEQEEAGTATPQRGISSSPTNKILEDHKVGAIKGGTDCSTTESKTIQCPACKADNPDLKQYCGDCGAALSPETDHINQQVNRVLSECCTDRVLTRYEITEQADTQLGSWSKVVWVLGGAGAVLAITVAYHHHRFRR